MQKKLKKILLVGAIGAFTLVSPVAASDGDLYSKINEVGDSAYLKNNKDEVSVMILGKKFILKHADEVSVGIVVNGEKIKLSLPLGGVITSLGKGNLWLQYARDRKQGRKTLFIYLKNN